MKPRLSARILPPSGLLSVLLTALLMAPVVLAESGEPGPVQNLSASRDAAGRLVLTWDPPLSDGGSEISHYNVYELSFVNGWVLVAQTVDTTFVDSPSEFTFVSFDGFRVSATNSNGLEGAVETLFVSGGTGCNWVVVNPGNGEAEWDWNCLVRDLLWPLPEGPERQWLHETMVRTLSDTYNKTRDLGGHG